jgi:hypothetical protein
MSILEISTAVFPTLTLVWKYLQVNLQFNIQHQMKIGSPLLMLEERDLLGRPIPQYLEGKNLQTPISVVCQFSSNCSIKLLPEERVDWCTTCVSDVRDLSSCGNIR